MLTRVQPLVRLLDRAVVMDRHMAGVPRAVSHRWWIPQWVPSDLALALYNQLPVWLHPHPAGRTGSTFGVKDEPWCRRGLTEPTFANFRVTMHKQTQVLAHAMEPFACLTVAV